MIFSLKIEQVKEMMVYVSRHIIEKKEELNQADHHIGDGDHGGSMAAGFSQVIQVVLNEPLDSISEIFKQAGNTFIAVVGGCAGIIFGTFFRSGSKAIEGETEFNAENLALFLDAAIKAIMKRGGAKPGDKTLLDALQPALEAALKMKDCPLQTSMAAIAKAAYQGMETTKQMLAKTGRGKTYGERSLGHPDPGSITTYLIFQFMSEYLEKISRQAESADD